MHSPLPKCGVLRVNVAEPKKNVLSWLELILVNAYVVDTQSR